MSIQYTMSADFIQTFIKGISRRSEHMVPSLLCFFALNFILLIGGTDPLFNCTSQKETLKKHDVFTGASPSTT